MAVELSTTQFQACQDANGQFCSITTPFQPLGNPPSCIAALYVKSMVDIASKCSLQIFKASAPNLPTQIASYTSYSSNKYHDINMSGEAHGNHSYTETNTHTEATYGLQFHLI